VKDLRSIPSDYRGIALGRPSQFPFNESGRKSLTKDL